ncbi:hypothetical protein [Myceligenerans crystallogenes]
MTRRTAQEIGDLREQIQVAISGLALVETAPAIRVRRRGSAVELAACELWGRIGERPAPRRLCGLPAGRGLRMQYVERAVLNTGLTFETTGPEGRGLWRHFTIQRRGHDERWFELPLLVPGAQPVTPSDTEAIEPVTIPTSIVAHAGESEIVVDGPRRRALGRRQGSFT